jgi:hypothetical protein
MRILFMSAFAACLGPAKKSCNINRLSAFFAFGAKAMATEP